MGVLQVIAAVLMLFFLPGYTFINMLFPKRGELDLEYDQLYRIGLGMGMSIVISILVGYVLGYSALFYAKYIWIALINLTVIFFVVGFYRGGYPTIRRMIGLEKEDKHDKLVLLDTLLKERKKKIKELEEIERLIRINPRRKDRYEERRKKVLEEIRNLDMQIDELKGVVDEI
ncbi:Protein of unknown function (DUF1616) [Aciduliprofundum sp. MAR08-339]|uniref:DUF1616 domain-containing protein n=1 Tax=Aciduliprofundum sp. (strain MAR08-339) TaxID=673860 RepID=UPI0002A488C3|nr:Protein of unknown function (DUF1616) [Aciduliprofundum sp. MAR08-339]